MKVLFDTNILTRLVNPEPDDVHDLAKKCVDAVVADSHLPCVLPQNIYEFWSVATRPTEQNGLGMSTEAARAEVDSILQHFYLLRDERAIFGQWLDLVTLHDVKGKPAHDARLVAGMLRHGLSEMVTFNDKDFARYAQVTTHIPVALASGRASIPHS